MRLLSGDDKLFVAVPWQYYQYWGPPGFFWDLGRRGIYFQRAGEHR